MSDSGKQPAASVRRPRSFINHAATYAIGNIARRLVGFVMLPIYTRFLAPADYGVIGLLTFSLALLEPIFGARLIRAIPKFYFEVSDAHSKRAVIWGALTLTAAVSALTMSVVILVRNAAAQLLFGNEKYALALGIFAVNLLTQPIESAGMGYIRLQMRSRLFLMISIIKLLLQLSLNLLLLVYWRGGVVGVVESGVIASAAVGIGLTAFVAMHERPAFDWQLARRMFQFSWPLWLSGIAGLYIGSSGAMYLRVFDTLSDVGRLELALKFASAVGLLIWTPFSQHWEPMSFKYYREEGGRLKFQVAFVAVSASMFIVGLGISIFAEPVIRVMAAKSFHGAAVIVPILTLGLVLNSLRSFFNFSFIIADRTKILGLWQYGTAAFITVAYVVLVPRFGLAGAAFGQCLTFGVSFVFVRIASRKYYDPKFHLLPIGIFTLIGLIAYLCANVLPGVPAGGVDLTIKSLVMSVAAGLIGLTAVREIRRIDVVAFDNLPWPLNRLAERRLRTPYEIK